jgi:hypothetical protein
MSTKNRWGFHGEVTFTECTLPAKTKLFDSNVLQGSTTKGHEHVVKRGGYELKKLGERLFLVAKRGVVVGMSQATERHKDTAIPPGVWEIKRAIEASRPVSD